MKIGLTMRVRDVPDRIERWDCLDQAWPEFVVDLGHEPVLLPNLNSRVRELVDRKRIGGIILTGGNDLAHLPGAIDIAPERDSLERELLSIAAERDMPLLGVCRGLQLMACHYGSTLTRVEGHLVTRHPLKAVSDSGPLVGPRPEVNSFHAWGMPFDGLGADLRALMVAPDGTVETVRHQQHNQWGIMWHPERSPRCDADRRFVRTLFAGGPS